MNKNFCCTLNLVYGGKFILNYMVSWLVIYANMCLLTLHFYYTYSDISLSYLWTLNSHPYSAQAHTCCYLNMR